MRSLTKWCLALLLGLAVLAGGWWSVFGDSRSWPIRWLEVGGELERLTASQIRAAVAGHAHRGFFGIDVNAARAAVESLPWVARAAVARQWPDALSITVVERRAVARWNAEALVGADGALFRVAGVASMQGLVDLAGPPERHEQVVGRWRDIVGLLRPRGIAATRVEMDARGSWRVVLADGPELLLGRDQIERRLRRFLSVRTALARRGPIARIDLRYPNGLSLTPARAPDAGRLADRANRPQTGMDTDHG